MTVEKSVDNPVKIAKFYPTWYIIFSKLVYRIFKVGITSLQTWYIKPPNMVYQNDIAK